MMKTDCCGSTPQNINVMGKELVELSGHVACMRRLRHVEKKNAKKSGHFGNLGVKGGQGLKWILNILRSYYYCYC